MTPTAPPSVEPLMSVEGLCKRFGSTQALKDVSLHIETGTVLALVGENGAGKSTLVKLMSGVLLPDTGRILLDGEQIHFPDSRAAAQAGIHLVHQELALLPERTVVENVFLGNEERSRLGPLRWPEMRAKARQALSELGVDLDVDTRVRNLSVANQQMVEIARTLVRAARLIVLDEPTAALSPAEAERLFAVIRRMTLRGTAFIYISHRLDEVVELADRIIVLKDGRHVHSAARGELTVERMIQLMVGRDVSALFPDRSSASTSAAPLLEVRDLIDPPAVHHASFALYPGEIVGLYGLEGHGQDEVLACLAGARRPVRGTLLLRGAQRPWRAIASMIDAGFGYVPQDRKTEGLLLELSGSRNITLPVLRRLSRLGVVSPRREDQAARKAARTAGVQGNLNTSVASLSGGNQQKIVLARLLAAGSDVLLLNQPTRGVDVGSKAEIYRVIRDMCQTRGTAALVVSREITELQGLCDRILVMSHGELRDERCHDSSEEQILAAAVGL